MVVVLPAPFGPRSPNTSPWLTSRETVLDADYIAVMLGQVFQLNCCVSVTLH